MFIVTSVFALGLFLTGYVVTTLLRCTGGGFERAALAIAAGLLLDHVFVLMGLPLRYVLGLMAATSLVGLWWISADLSVAGIERPSGTAIATAAAAIVLLIAYYVQILVDPLMRWDARSVWFFHAKMIWLDGALRGATGFDHPSVAFASPDYPNLVPALAAQLAFMKGFWNEFLPKASLVVMFLPLMLWVFSFREFRASFLLLVLLFFFSYNAWMWNGYMDGYVALYTGVALLCLGRYFTLGRRVDVFSTICCLGVVAMTKNEGLLIAATVTASTLAVIVWRSRFDLRQIRARLGREPGILVAALLVATPVLMWATATRMWGFQNALVGDTSGFSRAAARLGDGSSPQFIFEFLFQRATAMGYLVTIVALAAASCVWLRVRVPAGCIVATLTAVLYASGLYAVYLSTPVDIFFHLNTSAGRTMATVSVALFVATYFLLASIETLSTSATASTIHATTITAEHAEQRRGSRS